MTIIETKIKNQEIGIGRVESSHLLNKFNRNNKHKNNLNK